MFRDRRFNATYNVPRMIADRLRFVDQARLRQAWRCHESFGPRGWPPGCYHRL